MIRPFRRAPRQIFSLTLAASAILGGSSLLPQRADAQAMGGLGHRSSSHTGGSASQQQPRNQPSSNAPFFPNAPVNNTPMMPTQNPMQNPTQNNNAPIFSRPNGQYQPPAATVAPISPPATMVAPIMPPAVTVNPMPQYSTGPTYEDQTARQDAFRNRRNRGSINAPVNTNAGDSGSRRRVPPSGTYDSTTAHLNAPVYGASHGSVRVTTPIGQRSLPRTYYNNDYFYNAPVTIVGGPALLGGYYYGNYTDTYVSQFCYPSVYNAYFGFPAYIVSPSLIVIGQPYYPAYETSFLPFYPPTYQVTYNQNNYYVASEERAHDIEKGGEPAQKALKSAFPAGSYQAAFADIEQAWNQGRITLLRKHLREDDVKLSIYFKGKYTYSISSADFAQITRDAFDRLNTVSFRFTRLRKAKNGDVTAYGKHVYRATDDADSSRDTGSKADETVPFSTDGTRMYDNADDPAPGVEKTVYVSYTLRRHDDQWYIIGVNSSPTDMTQTK